MSNFMPHASFQQGLWQLRFTFTPHQYTNLMEEYKKPEKHLLWDVAVDEYWRKLPQYTIARCPLCYAEYTSAMDTHGISRWSTRIDIKESAFGIGKYHNIGCNHFVAIQTFLNFNGVMPTEEKYIANLCGDIPIVMPELFVDDMRTAAVIHSLPICRIENEQFVPRYSVYTITYYADDGKEMWRRHKALANKYSQHWLAFFFSSERMSQEPEVGDLRLWVERGRLHWLDITNPRLPLKSGPIQEFPYNNIKGYGYPFTYQRKPEPQNAIGRLFWNKEGKIVRH